MQALVLKPRSAETFSAMGLIYALKNDLQAAISYLHSSLGIRRDDVVTSNLLKSCIEEMMDDDVVAPLSALDALSILDANVDLSIDTGSTSQGKPKLPFNPISRCKINFNFEDDSTNSNSSEVVDTSLDMSMDV